MSYRVLTSVGPAVALPALLPAIALGQRGAADRWTAPRTSWGAPDLQGLWTSATLTPLERPRRQSQQVRLTDEEAAALERQSEERRAASDGKSSPGSVGGYNQVWMDAGTQFNRYFGPFSVKLQSLTGAHFGDHLSAYRLRLRNMTAADLTVTLAGVDSESVPSGETAIA